MTICTRFAPSPTGYLHVGGARTALYCWLYAKKMQGKFILRIEDTDRERSTEASVQAILDGMAWLGLDCDEGPVYQTDRMDRYRQVIQTLIDNNQAYRCYCSKERLTAIREQQMVAKEKPRYDGCCREGKPEGLSEDAPYVIRFKNPVDGAVIFDDLILGEIKINNTELDDLIIARTDGTPTYNLTVVVDDADMNITHVLRGNDHINNTPRQINLFKALDLPVPHYAHVPMILGDDGKRLSKRHGAVSVMQYRDEGYLPQALLNYLVRLGWSHGDQEIFSIKELIEYFDIKNINRAAAAFNTEKLNWLNQKYIKNTAPEIVAEQLIWQFENLNLDINTGPQLVDIIQLMADRCKTLKEMAEKSQYFYQEITEYNQDAVKKHIKENTPEYLQAFYQNLSQLSDWDADNIGQVLNDCLAKFDIKMPKLAPVVRIAVSGDAQTPSIGATLALLGKDKTINRLQNFCVYLNR